VPICDHAQKNRDHKVEKIVKVAETSRFCGIVTRDMREIRVIQVGKRTPGRGQPSTAPKQM
jgi:hypothetical protein